MIPGYRVIRTFFLGEDKKLYDEQMVDTGLGSDKVLSADIDVTPTRGEETHPISSSWAYDNAEEMRALEEAQELADLESAYTTLMANEHHTSNRRGYEVR